jgi:broad specificity phosphatase PhoE
VPDDRLREFGNVYADGVPVPPDHMPVEYPGFWGTSRPHTTISAEGENWVLFRARVGAFLEDILARHREDDRGAIVVVCHDGIVQAAFDHVFNIGPSRQTEILTHNTGITHLEFHPGAGGEAWRLHSHGLVAHLLGSGNGQLLGEHQLLRSAGGV